jgi:type II secretory pathway component PulF
MTIKNTLKQINKLTNKPAEIATYGLLISFVFIAIFFILHIEGMNIELPFIFQFIVLLVFGISSAIVVFSLAVDLISSILNFLFSKKS